MRFSLHKVLKTILCAVPFILAVSSPAMAQTPHRTNVDITFGEGSSWGGNRNYTDRGNAAISVAVTPYHSGNRVAAVALSLMQTFGGIETCFTREECALRFPGTTSLAALYGVEFGDAKRDVRAELGPAFFASSESGAGAQAILGASHGGKRFALTATLRGSIDVRFTGEVIRFGSAEVGLRIR